MYHIIWPTLLGSLYNTIRLSEDYDYIFNDDLKFEHRYKNFLSATLHRWSMFKNGQIKQFYNISETDTFSNFLKEKIDKFLVDNTGYTLEFVHFANETVLYDLGIISYQDPTGDDFINDFYDNYIAKFRYDIDFITKSLFIQHIFQNEHHIEAGRDIDNLLTRVKDSIAIIDIYYETLKIEKIIENEDDVFISLFSDIGGQLGLWLGISIVSLMEILHFLCFSWLGRSLREVAVCRDFMKKLKANFCFRARSIFCRIMCSGDFFGASY